MLWIFFPEEIFSITKDDIEVSIMIKAEKYWKWPHHQISRLEVAGFRGQYLFQDILSDRNYQF